MLKYVDSLEFCTLEQLAPIECPITRLLNFISAKWTVEIIRELSIGPTRTRRFLARTPGLTMKSLRQRLVAMEYEGIVNRHKYDEKPPKVEYSLTTKGKRLAEFLVSLKALADEFDGPACSCPIEGQNNQDCEASCPRRRVTRFLH